MHCRPEEYKKKVADYVRKYASEEALRNLRDPAEVSSDSESSMSDFSEDEAGVRTDKIYISYSLFIYQDENENQSFRSFLYVLKQTCDEQTNLILRVWFVRHRQYFNRT